ncbi:MAG: hypothetical protein JSR90_12805 [Proteobacteria bacterium]|nr:hypothetical protein [Pseudomonadota bacterium]
MPRDRIDYLTALSTSWKQQTLNNVVHIRYGDAPAFLDVSSIVSSYDMQGQVSAGMTSNVLSTNAANQLPWNVTTVGANVVYADRPTISYAPLSGEKLTRRLIKPIPPLGIFELLQAGNAADAVLQVAVRSLNGIRNQGVSGGILQPADPEFYPLLDAFRRLQIAGLLSVRTERRNNDEVGVFIIDEGKTEQTRADVKYIRDTLRLKPGKDGDLTIVFGAHQRNGNELAVLSRSMGDILIDLSMGIDVPEADVAAGRTVPTVRPITAKNPRERPLVHIHSGPAAPAHAYAAVNYDGTAFWIDDDDYASKRTFTLLMIFTSLAETGVVAQNPTLTIPVR